MLIRAIYCYKLDAPNTTGRCLRKSLLFRQLIEVEFTVVDFLAVKKGVVGTNHFVVAIAFGKPQTTLR